jgi:hypothetical protein
MMSYSGIGPDHIRLAYGDALAFTARSDSTVGSVVASGKLQELTADPLRKAVIVPEFC